MFLLLLAAPPLPVPSENQETGHDLLGRSILGIHQVPGRGVSPQYPTLDLGRAAAPGGLR